MAGVERPDQVERLRPTNLTDDYPVGPESERRSQQRADGHLTGALGICWMSLEPDHMAWQPELGRVLDGHDPLAGRDQSPEEIEEGGLPGAGASRDNDRLPFHDGLFEKADLLRSGSAQWDQGMQRVDGEGEAADGDDGVIDCGGWDHGMETAAVGEPGIDHRRRAVDAQAEWGEHPLDGGDQGLVALECRHRSG